jgi:hypothetical protein
MSGDGMSGNGTSGKMNDDHYAELGARILREARAKIAPRVGGDLERVLPLLGGAVRRAHRVRRARIWIASGAAAAAAVIVPLMMVHSRGGGALRAAGAAPTPIPVASGAVRDAQSAPFTLDGSQLPAAFLDGSGAAVPAGRISVLPGDRLIAADTPVALRGPDGTELGLEPGTDLRLARADATRLFRLARGALQVHVAKLHAGQRFVVATPDREVEVRGTRFRVAVVAAESDCGGGAVTRVAVEEGVVVVRRADGAEERVTAGGVWPADCHPRQIARLPAQRHRAAARVAAPAVPIAEAPASKEVGDGQPPAASTLGLENELFGRAARAEREGDPAKALLFLDQLITKYPNGSLRESAEIERTEILGKKFDERR